MLSACDNDTRRPKFWKVDTQEPTKAVAPAVSDEALDEGALFVMPAGPLMATFDSQGELVWQDAHGTDQLTVLRTPTGAMDIASRARTLNWVTEHSVTTAIRVAALGRMTYRGRSVPCANGALVRSIDLAIEWRGWVVASARTSLTDNIRAMEPPFPGLELIWFRARSGAAGVRVLSSVDFGEDFFAWGVPTASGPSDGSQ